MYGVTLLPVSPVMKRDGALRRMWRGLRLKRGMPASCGARGGMDAPGSHAADAAARRWARCSRRQPRGTHKRNPPRCHGREGHGGYAGEQQARRKHRGRGERSLAQQLFLRSRLALRRQVTCLSPRMPLTHYSWWRVRDGAALCGHLCVVGVMCVSMRPTCRGEHRFGGSAPKSARAHGRGAARFRWSCTAATKDRLSLAQGLQARWRPPSAAHESRPATVTTRKLVSEAVQTAPVPIASFGGRGRKPAAVVDAAWPEEAGQPQPCKQAA